MAINNNTTSAPDPLGRPEADPNAIKRDELTADFIPFYSQYGTELGIDFSTRINNFTSFNLERDFFVPADAFTIVIEDDRVQKITDALQGGMGIRFAINDIDIMYGYVFEYDLEYSRTAHRLTLSGQDLLGWMNKAVCYPNMWQSGDANFHFKPTTTIKQALQTIVDAFAGEVSLPQYPKIEIGNGLSTADANALANSTFATGFLSGLKAGGPKQPKNLTADLNRALDHLSRPLKGEKYLAYAQRLAKHIGANIKMKQGTNDTIVVSPPTYENSTGAYIIKHSLETDAPYGDASNQSAFANYNTVISGSIKINVADQPTVIIAELNTHGNNSFYKSTYKAVKINEITGYPRVTGGLLKVPGRPESGNVDPVDNVFDALFQLTQFTGNGGYDIIQPQQKLYDIMPQTGWGIETGVSLPRYYVDTDAHTQYQGRFGCAMAMAEAQDKYMTLNYTVDGFAAKGQGANQPWYPNNTCLVYDEAMSKKNPINDFFWIKKVNWTKSRDGGSHAHIELTLPYTHNFTIEDTSSPDRTTLNPDEAINDDGQIWRRGTYVAVPGKFVVENGKSYQVYRYVNTGPGGT